MKSIFQRIADELNCKVQQVQAAVQLLDEGATVPFIARYRKEVTEELDDTQLRTLEERLRYLRELEERRTAILNSIKEQQKLTAELEQTIKEADTKTRLEDLYLPYKPKRRTKAQIAREAGLEPLALSLFEDPSLNPEKEAVKYFNEEHKITDNKSALDGAKFILMEKFSEDATLLGQLRDYLWNNGQISSRCTGEKQAEAQKFRDYFEYDEAIKKIPSHRALAILRGRNEGFLDLKLIIPGLESTEKHPGEIRIAEYWQIRDLARPADNWLQEVVRWTWRVKLLPHIETDLITQVRTAAEDGAIKVFSENLKDLLLAAPAGLRATIGVDPGLRTGCKVAVVDNTGKLLDHATIYPHAPQNRWDEAIVILAALCQKYQVELISFGNGTASRETDKLALDLSKKYPQLKLTKIMVSEAGASVYSASEFAAKEFPDLDVTIRGAVSIARRLQDPLAELVKIEPKSIGVGQYQHDVNQIQLARSLDASVEDCVNAVGVDVNTASAPLLSRVSGLNNVIANNIVAFRDKNGAFTNRSQLKKIPRLGDKTFEQAAGFLRIMNGDNPLDASAVHPESYVIIDRIAQKHNRSFKGLIGDCQFLRRLKAEDYADDQFGEPTVKDILSELEKPGRDPRPEFKAAQFKEGVETIGDLESGMILEGSVTNVTNFGAFVDVGVHQDGLVHISVLANEFVADPREIVKAGDIVKVKVLEVDIPRKRISLSMRLDDQVKEAAGKGEKPNKHSSGTAKQRNNKTSKATNNGTFAQLFANAQQKKGKRL